MRTGRNVELMEIVLDYQADGCSWLAELTVLLNSPLKANPVTK